MKVTFILPSIGRKAGQPYVRTWSMEPLAISVLSALTDPSIDRRFFDDRMEAIDYDDPTDLVALSVETYTACRAYQIAAQFRERNVPVVMGGFHPTLAPDDALNHADTIVMGEAEDLWPQLLTDFSNNNMKRIYRQSQRPSLSDRFPDRTIYQDRKYLSIALIETSRGCCHQCDFCSISQFFHSTHRQRPVADVIREIKNTGAQHIFFTDDNIGMNSDRFRELLTALIPLKIAWAAQITLEASYDPQMLKLMEKSGCMCVLIGFESLNRSVLSSMNKMNNGNRINYDAACRLLRKYGIGVYGTFVFGYDNDDESSFNKTYKFAVRNGFYFTAFNHLIPFPGTPLYDRLQQEERLLFPKWWLSEQYHFGDVPYRVNGMDHRKLAGMCFASRKRFYGMASMLRRMMNWRANCRSFRRLFLFVSLNLMSRFDVKNRQKLSLGMPEELT